MAKITLPLRPWYWLAALGLHAWLLAGRLPAVPKLTATQRHTQKITVRISHRAVRRHSQTPSAMKSGHSLAKSPGTLRPKVAATRARGLAYQDLLPGADYVPAGKSGGAPLGYSAPTTAQGIVADEVLGKLDIPLVFRSAGAEVKAIAKIILRPAAQAGWSFAFVDGDPVLRAVLYEALREPANRRLVADLFHRLRDTEVLIVLHQYTVVTTSPGQSYQEAFVLSGNKLTVERTLFVGAGGPGGGGLSLTLPDKEADRAKMRDRVHLEQLETSPAYISPIRDRDP